TNFPISTFISKDFVPFVAFCKNPIFRSSECQFAPIKKETKPSTRISRTFTNYGRADRERTQTAQNDFSTEDNEGNEGEMTAAKQIFRFPLLFPTTSFPSFPSFPSVNQ